MSPALATHQTAAIVVCTILSSLFAPIVSARLWTRYVLQRSAAIEDLLILIAAVSTIALLIVVLLAVTIFRYGSHTSELTTNELVNAGWLLYMAEAAYIVITGVTKFAILLFYYRLAGQGIRTHFKYALWICMSEIILYKSLYLIIISTECQPLQARWQALNPAWTSKHQWHCPMSEAANIFVGSTISATEDLIIAVLPCMLLWNMKISFRAKCGIWSLFAVSTTTSIAGYARSYTIYKAYYLSDDPIYYLYWLWLLSAVELCLGLICSSVPALKPFLKHHRIMKKLSSCTSSLPSLPTLSLHRRRRTTQPSLSSIIGNSIFEGTGNYGDIKLQGATSQAQVTWNTMNLADQGPTDRRSSRDKSMEITVKNDVESFTTVEDPDQDKMWINVHTQVSIRKEQQD